MQDGRRLGDSLWSLMQIMGGVGGLWQIGAESKLGRPRMNPDPATIDVKILAAPGAALERTAKRIWAAAAQARRQVAVECLPFRSDWALHGCPALPAVLVNGRVVHAGSIPSAAKLKNELRR
jgi:hypothetical protein